MSLLVVLLILALVFGGIGLLVEGLFWLLVIGAALLIASLVVGVLSGRRA
jgi:hypothetical protein